MPHAKGTRIPESFHSSLLIPCKKAIALDVASQRLTAAQLSFISTLSPDVLSCIWLLTSLSTQIQNHLT